MTQPILTALGKYRITDPVGEGAMGMVYRAVDTVLDRAVAIKVMNEAIAQQDDLRKRFLREAQAAGSLQHPNIVCIYDFGEAEGHLFIAMEFIQGVDLEELIGLREPLSLQSKLDIMIDVITGLAFAHKRGVVHRDIKPANIRVGEDGRARLMDFGVAHLASSSITTTGLILGTPTYMAPEQITGGAISAASDIFSVGAVLYQVLTSQRPFYDPNLQQLLFKIVSQTPRQMSELVPDLPVALVRIVDRAMAKDPSERYGDALDMANDLAAVRSSLSGPSYPATVFVASTVASAMEHAGGRRSRLGMKLVYARAGILAAAAVVAIAWSLLVKPVSTKVEAVEHRPPAVAPSSLAVITLPAKPNANTSKKAVRGSPRVVQAAAASTVAKRDTTALRPETSAGPPPKEIGADPRHELAAIGITWSTQSFVNALEAGDGRVVGLFIDGGMSPTVLHLGAPAVVYILQPLLPDPIPMLKLLIEKGYDVNTILTDTRIMTHYGSVPPYWVPPPDLPNYSSFSHTFSGPALMWVAMRAAYAGPTPSDLAVIDFLRSRGADTRITRQFLAAMESGWGNTAAYKTVRARVTQ